MCQLIKVGTMLFDGKNIDEHGRSQLFLSYIFCHKIIQNGFYFYDFFATTFLYLDSIYNSMKFKFDNISKLKFLKHNKNSFEALKNFENDQEILNLIGILYLIYNFILYFIENYEKTNFTSNSKQQSLEIILEKVLFVYFTNYLV